MKKVLILGAPVFQIPIVQKAKELGLTSIKSFSINLNDFMWCS